MKADLFVYLSYFIQVPMTIPEALTLIERKIKDRKICNGIGIVKEKILEGKPVSESFVHIVHVVGGDSTVISMIKSAEKSGDFNNGFLRIAEYIEKKAEVRRKLVESITYPTLIFLFSICMSYAIVSFIFPKILPIFSSMKVDVPYATKLILLCTGFVEGNILVILLMSVLVIYVVKYVYGEYVAVREYIQSMFLKVPVLATFIFSNYSLHISRSLEVLLKSESSLADAMNNVLQDLKYIPIQKDMHIMCEMISQGVTLSTALQATRYFKHTPWVELSMVGEATGRLDASLSYLSKIYTEDISKLHRRISKWVEPVLMFCIAGVVLFVSLSVIQPMYSIVEHVSP
ncbi:MAG: hypothetical protein FGM57_00220 [Candidatus Taylorbacteria bacterium]|nr:hypothetical protein [Candidatus Taylorbacteria bacterium]